LIQYREVTVDSIPMSLLLLADPLESKVCDYLNGATCFGAFIENELVSVCVTNTNIEGEIELFNIASLPNLQGQGIGTKLLEFVISELKNCNVTKLVLGTGTFGHQLAFYQRLGFRVDAVVKNFFTDNYDEPIYENGIQHYDMLRLTIFT
jgi:ribosomal protein S18 acetylase RimI-like enzyme